MSLRFSLNAVSVVAFLLWFVSRGETDIPVSVFILHLRVSPCLYICATVNVKNVKPICAHLLNLNVSFIYYIVNELILAFI